VSVTPQPILCDGCGLPASPEHIRERLARLELATRFRPIHISVLFVTPAPEADVDFYDITAPPSPAHDLLLAALSISPSETAATADRGPSDANSQSTAAAASATELRLAEFQRRGFYFASTCECPLPHAVATQAVERLAPTFLKRVQFSYKPKFVVLLSDLLAPMVPLLCAGGQGIRILPDGQPLPFPRQGDRFAETAFRAACAHIAAAQT